MKHLLLTFAAVLLVLSAAAGPSVVAAERLRVMVETDAGGDPDDEQSLVRFLLYASEWDVEGIIANRAEARPGENRNVARSGHAIVLQMVDAYGEVYPKLKQHDSRYPEPEALRRVTVAGYADRDDGEKLILSAVNRDDPRPLWFMNWGTDRGSGPSNLLRALNRVRRERGAEGYAPFKRKLRLSSADKFEEHTWQIEPPFPLWVDTFRPEVDRKRWYHRFSALTSTAGGFDIQRDVLSDHGPLGALYPTNTTHPQKEGDSMTFLYLVPTGMNDPQQPTWGSWAGRYALQDEAMGKPYYWAGAADAWHGSVHRDNSLARWAAHLQNDFRARMDWCVNDRSGANHPPHVRLHIGGKTPSDEAAADATIVHHRAVAGSVLTLDASASRDPDGDRLQFQWQHYPESGGSQKMAIDIQHAMEPTARVALPSASEPGSVHVVLVVTDDGQPPLTRYGRLVIEVQPRAATDERKN